MRQAKVEKGIVKRGVEQGIEQEKTTVAPLSQPERESPTLGHRQDDQPRETETDTREEHLAARHFRRDRKFLESQLDQRIGPSPDHRRREGENGHPKWPLKQADRLRLLFFHRMHLVLKTLRMSHKAKHTKHKGSL